MTGDPNPFGRLPLVRSTPQQMPSASTTTVGLVLPSGRLLWFSRRYTVSDFTRFGLPMQPDANLDISSYETLAQRFVLLAFWKAHGSGEKNNDADLLSRWDGASSLPAKFLPANRIKLSLEEARFQVSLFPSDTFLLWEPPAPHTLGPSKKGSKKRK